MWQYWLTKIPYVIQFTTLLNDTSPYADLVLPVPTYLEQWDLSLPVPNLPFAQLGLQQPIVSPIDNSRPLGDILIQLSQRLGRGFLPKHRLTDYRDFVRSRMQEVFASGQGTPFFEAISLEWLEELRKRGWRVYSYPTFSEFWRLLEEKGGWWEPRGYSAVVWGRHKKFTFITDSRLTELLSEKSWQSSNRKDRPLWDPPQLWVEKAIPKPEAVDTFVLFLFTTLFNITGEGASQPLLQELFGLHHRRYWQTWAEMNPERAKALMLKDGDLIRIVSENGSLILPVRVVPSVAPEILAVPFGQGHRGLGRYARNIGQNPLAILDPRVDPMSGWSSWQSTLVRVERIEGKEHLV